MQRRPLELKSPHGVQVVEDHGKVWNDVHVHAVGLSFSRGRVWHDLSSDRSCLNIVLEKIGGQCHARTRIDVPPPPALRGPRHIDFAPAGMPLWGYSENIRRIHGVRCFFDADRLGSVLGEDVDVQEAEKPRLHFEDARIFALGELLAAACTMPDDLDGLYGDSLTVALVIDYLRLGKRRTSEVVRGTLAPWQLRRATEFIETHLSQRVRLRDLAELTGLSQSQFGRAFKASTGVSPYRWQLKARTARAQQLLLDGDLPIAQIALATGFSEQSHFTRVFHSVVGATPGAWRRDRRA